MHTFPGRKKSKHVALIIAALSAFGLAEGAKAGVVFSDTFAGGSSLNPATYPTVTSTSTGYDVASTKNQSPASTLASGHLKIGLAGTTSGVDEVQALFAASPVVLASAGDSIDYQLVFTNTTGLLGGGTSCVLYAGLYSSGGTAPISGLNNSGLSTGLTTAATGGTQLWQGYNAQIAQTGGSSKAYTRPMQSGTTNATNAHQDLDGNGAGGGLYNDPVGTQVGGSMTSTVATLTAGSQYTDDLTITLNADGSETIASNLYAGVGTGGTNLSTQSVNTGAGPLTTSFDGLSFGYRQSGTSIATGMDVNSLTITTASGGTVPEPASIGLLGLMGIGLLRRRKVGV